jgi:hypothetical protein
MDLSCLTADEIMEFARGWMAARAAEPFDPSQTRLWREGFRFWTMMAVPTSPNPITIGSMA